MNEPPKKQNANRIFNIAGNIVKVKLNRKKIEGFLGDFRIQLSEKKFKTKKKKVNHH
jgi:hypothetical protein